MSVFRIISSNLKAGRCGSVPELFYLHVLVGAQEKATKWKNPDGHMDGLTTNGVLVMHPQGFPEDPKQGLWREISVCGDVYALRETRSGPSRGKLVSRRAPTLPLRLNLESDLSASHPVNLTVTPHRRKVRAAPCVTAPWSTCVVPPCFGGRARA